MIESIEKSKDDIEGKKLRLELVKVRDQIAEILKEEEGDVLEKDITINKFLGTSKNIKINQFMSKYKAIYYSSFYFELRKNINRQGKKIYHETIVQRELENQEFLIKNPDLIFVKKNSSWLNRNDFYSLVNYIRENNIKEYFECE